MNETYISKKLLKKSKIKIGIGEDTMESMKAQNTKHTENQSFEKASCLQVR